MSFQLKTILNRLLYFKKIALKIKNKIKNRLKSKSNIKIKKEYRKNPINFSYLRNL